MNAPSYAELCLNALPPEKQTAARQAFKDLLEGAPDDSMLSRLLIVLEATAAYGRTIPAEITVALQSGIAELDARLGKFTTVANDADESRLKQLREVLEKQLPAMAASFSLDTHTTAVASLRVAVERLERSVRRLRHVRIGAVSLLMLLAAGLGAGGIVAYFKSDYDIGQRLRRRHDYLLDHGIQMRLSAGDNRTAIVSLEGPGALRGTEWVRDQQGRIVGVQLVYP